VRPAVLLAGIAIPVVVASFAGWAFGLAFVALSIIALGVIHNSRSIGTVLKATAAVTVASLGASIAVTRFDVGDDGDSGGGEPPAAKEPALDAPAEPPEKEPAAEKPSRKPDREPVPERKPRNERKPDNETKGLVRVPPSQALQVDPRTGEPTTTTPGGTVPPSQQQPAPEQP
jgi:hypothetical protein